MWSISRFSGRIGAICLKKGFNEDECLLEFMRALIVGSGNIGSVAAEDLARSVSDCEVVVSDKEEARARSISRKIGMKNVSWSALEATNRRELVKALGEFDLVMGFLPGELGYGLLEACIGAESLLLMPHTCPKTH